MAVSVSTGSRGSRNSRGSRERHSLLTSPTRDETEPLLTSSYAENSEPGPTLAHSIQQPLAELENTVSWWTLLRRRFNCRRACYNRIPKGKASLLIFLLNVIETLAFYGAVDGVLHLAPKSDRSGQTRTFFSLILQYTAGRLIYPITGILADAYFGRYKIVNGSLWLLWMAFALLSVWFSLGSTLNVSSVATVHILPIFTFVLICLGSAGFEANIIPFGVDQLSQGASSDEMSSYFYWYFAARQLGILIGTSVFIGFSFTFRNPYDFKDNFNTVSAMQSMFIVVFLTVGILLNMCFASWYFKGRERMNPVKLILQVLFFAACVKRQPPRSRRAFRYGEERKPRMELAKKEFDGRFSSEEVEDVKTFCRIILVLLSLTGYYIAYFGVYVMVSQQVSTLLKAVSESRSMLSNARLQEIFSTLYTTFDSTAILLYLPILNYLTRPFCPSVSMKERLGVGAAVNVIAAVACIFVRWTTQYLNTSPEHTLLWFLIPAALLAVAELYLFVIGLEFIYAQSPEHMKGLLTGIFYFIVGICNAGAALLFSHFPLISNLTSKRIDCILWYYVGYAITAVLGFVTYSVIAFLYTNRQRPTSNDDADMRILYQRRRY